MAKIDVDALAEEVTSAANIVTNGGYYEIDIDAVAQCLMRALAPAEADIAALREENARLREALGHAIGVIEAHVDRDALGMNGDPETGMWPLLDEYLHHFRAALTGARDHD